MIFSDFLIGWYAQNGRDLPWRKTHDPYPIWVSEVILQQTRVSQGIGYYYRFLDAFPSVADLANADLDSVLKVWQGLGYYSRARNMHNAAIEVVSNYNGVFPTSCEGLKALKGIGDYTSAAIASFAYNEAVPAIDGNVSRIISRYFGIDDPINTGSGKSRVQNAVSGLIDKQRAGLFNQAMMDLGAIVCTPKEPNCLSCPVAEGCFALANGKVAELPVKSGKVSKRDRFFNYVVPIAGNSTFLAKRRYNDIWNSLYEFPLIETDVAIAAERLVDSEAWQNIFGQTHCDVVGILQMPKHVLSHQNIFPQFIIVTVENVPSALECGYAKVSRDEIDKFSVPRLIDKFLQTETLEKNIFGANVGYLSIVCILSG